MIWPTSITNEGKNSETVAEDSVFDGQPNSATSFHDKSSIDPQGEAVMNTQPHWGNECLEKEHLSSRFY
jgi:hypothetical protein